MEREVAWKKYSDEDRQAVESLAADYIDFISDNKTERECAQSAIALAETAGYRPLSAAIDSDKSLHPGDKLWAQTHGKTLMLVHIGRQPISHGLNILGAHIDSPRLDIKQNPLYESNGFALLDTHYYGGIKNYQWVTLPLALHGVVAKKDGTVVPVVVGEDLDDPVFVVTDLLIHLASQQMEKHGNKVVEGEDLDVLIGNQPLVDQQDDSQQSDKAPFTASTATSSAAPVVSSSLGSAMQASRQAEADAKAQAAEAKSDNGKEAPPKEPVKEAILAYLRDTYEIEEDDFLSAELEVVPAGRARDLGFDRSMVLGYGQDDRVCAYTSLMAQLALADEVPETTAVTILVDKEEIGSVGATGMTSLFFENTIAEIMELSGEGGSLPLRRALSASKMLSSDVSAGFDPAYASVFETKNSAFLGKGLVFNKYTGARGKSGSNDADAEYMALIRKIMDEAGVSFQTAELGRVDAGGGGTIAYIPAKYGMNVIDSGVAVLSMHSPWEATSKADIYEAYQGYQAFLRNA